MGKEFIKLLEQIISPRRAGVAGLGRHCLLLIAMSVGVMGFNAYERLQRSHWEDLPLHTAIYVGGVS